MKNFSKLLGIIAVVAVIGFGMVACDNGSGGGGSAGGPSGGNGDAASTLTITGIPADLNGKYIMGLIGFPGLNFQANDTGLSASSTAVAGAKVENGTIKLNVFNGSSPYAKYTGSATVSSTTSGGSNNIIFHVMTGQTWATKGDSSAYYGTKAITFANGSVTIAWADLVKED